MATDRTRCPSCGKKKYRTARECKRCRRARVSREAKGYTRRDTCPDCGGTKYKPARRCQGCENTRRKSTLRGCLRCGRPIDPKNRGGVCQTCLDEARLGATTRVAEGEGSAEDRLRVENTRLRSENSSLRTTLERAASARRLEEGLLEAFTETLRHSPYRTTFTPPPKVKKHETAHEMMVVVSDAHYPEVVDPEACFGLVYNPDVCMARLQYLRDKVLRYRELRTAAYPVRKLTIVVNGDMVSGDIHEELEVTNAFPVTQAVVDLAYALYNLGLDCARKFPEVEMIVMPGNHARTKKKPRYKQKALTNWEWVMGKFIEALARKQFKVVVPQAMVYRHQVFDRWVGISHGDEAKTNSFMGIPFYALDRRRNAFQSLLRTLNLPQIDLLIHGHFHRLLYDDDLGFLINGSIKGGDEYSIGTRYSAAPPVQALITFHPEHWITDLSRINLGHL